MEKKKVLKNQEKRVTIVCCYNNKEQYGIFVESLKNQTMPYDLIGIDNSNQKYESCSRAYNSVISRIGTEYVIFSHQDIILDEVVVLEQFVTHLERIEQFDILGVAGAKAGEKRIFTNIHNGKGKFAGEERIVDMQEYDTVDECFFGGTRECFERYPFDEVLCDDWHLYAVERCLNAKVNGHKVYACGSSMIHNSVGRISHGFNVNLYKICKKYAGSFKQLRTTCANTRTDLVGRALYYFRREIRVWIEKHFVYK